MASGHGTIPSLSQPPSPRIATASWRKCSLLTSLFQPTEVNAQQQFLLGQSRNFPPFACESQFGARGDSNDHGLTRPPHHLCIILKAPSRHQFSLCGYYSFASKVLQKTRGQKRPSVKCGELLFYSLSLHFFVLFLSCQVYVCLKGIVNVHTCP